MTTTQTTSPGAPMPFSLMRSTLNLVSRLLRGRRLRPAPEHQPDAARARRAFIIDRLNENPEAFASEYDVQSMMAAYPHDF